MTTLQNATPGENRTLAGVTRTEALEAILANFAPLEAVEVILPASLGLVLAEDVTADINIPPFDNSSMDGYAIRSQDVAGASADQPAMLKLIGYLNAGSAPRENDRVEPGTAYRIMTGAPIPPGADAVVRIEDTGEGKPLDKLRLQPQDSQALQVEIGADVVIYQGVGGGTNVRKAGGDIVKGTVVLRAGTLIRAAEIGVLASVGKAIVKVHRRPRVVVLATGDELVDVGEMPGPGQIRNTNSYAITAQVRSWGAEAFDIGIARDNRESLIGKLQEAIALQPDLLVTSAGVSVGDYDIVKQVLLELGTINMWRVRIKPGKPLAFGRLTESGLFFFGLPGNPVSSMVTMELFGRPVLMRMMGRADIYRSELTARAIERIESSPGRENYIRAVVTQQADEYTARTTGAQGSEILTSMSKANALIVVGEDVQFVETGEKVRAIMLDQ
ncbi:MAG: gephyrin-like molybdotransferase Glp [Chloroflexia bacterium]